MDWSDIEIIAGQDHFWWLYSNKKDAYVETPFRIRDMTEDQLKARYDSNVKDYLKELDWIKEPGDI